MKKLLSFLKHKASQGFLLFFLFFALSVSAQTTLVEYNFGNSATWNTPNTLDAGILSTPTLKYWRPGANNTRTELTPNFDSGRLIAFQENDYIELEINTINYSSLNLSFNLKLLGRGVAASGSWNVTYNSGSGWAGNGGVTGITWFLDQTDDKTYNKPLPGDFSTVNPLLIRITATDWGFFGSTSLQLDNLKLTYGNPNITLYSDTNVEIPNEAEASAIYNTVYGNRETLLAPGESKTYRVRNFNGNTGSVLNINSIEIEPAAGTTANDFVVIGSSNITGLTRVTSSNSNNFGAITIQFIPQAEGVRSAVVKVYSNGAPSPYSFTVIGGGRSCNISNTAYVQHTMDPTLIQTLPSDLQIGDYVVGDNKIHSNILGGTTNIIYPSPNKGTYPLNTTSPEGSKSSWFTGGNTTMKTGEFGGSLGIDISNLRNVSVEFNVAAFAKSNGTDSDTKGVGNSDYISLWILDNGTWKAVMQLNGSDSGNNKNRRKYQFNKSGKIYSKNYSLPFSVGTTADNSGNNTATNGTAYSRFKFNIPLEYSKDITNFKFQIRAKANADAVWLIDDVRITSDNAYYKRWDGTSWKKWDGTIWVTTTRPTPKEKAVFDGDYDFTTGEATDLEICECEVYEGKTLTIPSPITLTVKGKVINDIANIADNFLIKSDANLIQIENGPVNEGEVNAQRFVKDVKNDFAKHMDYIYWSSPVSGQNLHNFSIGTPLNRIYQYNETNDYFNPVNLGTEPNFLPGKGYAFRAEDGLPYGTTGYEKTYEFKGVPNNGIINYDIQRSPNNGIIQHGYNMIGNPYPSNINFDLFYGANSGNIFKTAWFWINDDFTVTQSGSGYVGNGYAVYNGTGGNDGTIDDNPNNTVTTNQYIKIGQGFIVQKKGAPAANPPTTATLNFNNSMRVKNPGQFYSKDDEQKDRFWLKLVSPTNIANTMLVGYVPGATDGFEQDFDAESFGMSSDLFYSVLDDKKLLIQGKADFSTADKIIIGANFFSAGSYTISLMTGEGIFASAQSIYLKDNLLHTYTDLGSTSYTFDTNAGINEGRFEIVYENNIVLATGEAAKDNLLVYRNGNNYVIETSKAMKSVEVYDASGRLMKGLNSTTKKMTVETDSWLPGIYIFKINYEDGSIKTKKVIK